MDQSPDQETDQNDEALSPEIMQTIRQRVVKNLKTDYKEQSRTGVTRFATDIPKGVANGVVHFAQGVNSWVDQATGQQSQNYDLFESDSAVGDMTAATTSFLMGFLPLMTPMGEGAAYAKTALNLGKVGGAAADVLASSTAGAMSDFATGNPYEERLSSFIQDMPSLKNPVTEFLAADENDSFVKAKFKSALENAGFGIVTDGLFKVFGALKGVRSGKGSLKELQKAVEESSQALEFDKQLQAAAPQLTAEQRKTAWTMAAANAKVMGEDLDSYLSKRISAIRKGDEILPELAPGNAPRAYMDPAPEFTSAENPVPEVGGHMDPAPEFQAADAVDVTSGEPIQAGSTPMERKALPAAPPPEPKALPAAAEPKALPPATEPKALPAAPQPKALPEAGVDVRMERMRMEVMSNEDLTQRAAGLGIEWQGSRKATQDAILENLLTHKYASSLTEQEMYQQLKARGITATGGQSTWPAKLAEDDMKRNLASTVFFQNGDTGPRGVVQFAEDGKAVVGLFEKADASTFLHEMTHIWRRWLPADKLEQLSKLIPEFKGWDQTADEYVAQAFEKFLQNGQLNTPELSPLAGMFKQWLGEIYKGVGSQGPVNPELAKAFNSWFGGTQEVQQATKEAFQGSATLFQDAAARQVVYEKAEEAALEQIKNGKGIGEALSNTIYPLLNLDKMNVSQDAKGFMTGALNATEQIEKFLDRVRLHPETSQHFMAEVQKLAADMGTTEERALFNEALSRQTNKMDVKLLAAKLNVATVSEDVVNASRNYVQNNTPENLAKFQKMVQAWVDSELNYRESQSTFARGLSFLRNSVTPDRQTIMDRVAQIMANKDKGMPAIEFANQLAMAQNNPGAVSKLMTSIFNKTDDWFRKAVMVHNEYRVNSLLSGTVTYMTNLLGGTANILLFGPQRYIGGVLTQSREARESAWRVMGGLRMAISDSFRYSSLVAENLSERSAAGTALKSFLEDKPIVDELIYKGGNKTMDELFSRKISPEYLGVNPTSAIGHAISWLGTAVNMPMRTLQSSDEFMKGIAYRMQIFDQVSKEAFEKGIDRNSAQFGDYIATRMRDFFDNGRGINRDFLEKAQELTFTNELTPGLMKDWADMMDKHPLIKNFASPFIRVPTNIIQGAIDYTPLLGQMKRSFWNAVGSADPKVRADAMGKAAVGALFWSGAIMAAASGKLTGGGPTGKERETLQATGWQPYSWIQTNPDGSKTYVQYNRLDPSGMILGLAADFAENSAYMADADRMSLAATMSLAVARNLGSKTYLAGLSQLVDALNRPDQKAQAYLQNQAASYVPNLLKTVNPDDGIKDVRGVMDAMIAKLPYASESIESRRDMFGNPVVRPMGWPGRSLSPFALSTSVDDNVKEELAKLRTGFSGPATHLHGLDLTAYTNKGGQTALDRLRELQGKPDDKMASLHDAVKKLVGSKSYQALPAPDKPNDTANPRVQAVNSIVGAYRSAAEGKLLKEFPQIKAALIQAYRQDAQAPTLAMPQFRR